MVPKVIGFKKYELLGLCWVLCGYLVASSGSKHFLLPGGQVATVVLGASVVEMPMVDAMAGGWLRIHW